MQDFLKNVVMIMAGMIMCYGFFVFIDPSVELADDLKTSQLRVTELKEALADKVDVCSDPTNNSGKYSAKSNLVSIVDEGVEVVRYNVKTNECQVFSDSCKERTPVYIQSDCYCDDSGVHSDADVIVTNLSL